MCIYWGTLGGRRRQMYAWVTDKVMEKRSCNKNIQTTLHSADVAVLPATENTNTRRYQELTQAWWLAVYCLWRAYGKAIKKEPKIFLYLVKLKFLPPITASSWDIFIQLSFLLLKWSFSYPAALIKHSEYNLK